MKTADVSEWKGILVVGEFQQGRVLPVTMELIGKALELRNAGPVLDDVMVVLIGNRLGMGVVDLDGYGADELILVDDERLELFNNDLYGTVLEDIIRTRRPSVVLFPATTRYGDLAALLGIRLDTGAAAHCVDVRLSETGQLLAVVPAFGGKVLGDILCPGHRPQMATVKPGIFEKPSRGSQVETIINAYDAKEAIEKKTASPRLIARENAACELSTGIALEAAEVVVAGGWGMGSKENWNLIEELADLLGGAVGCTRPAVDEGWVEGESRMIGTSGKVIRPKVYIGAALSGSSHHVCGMKDADLVISINNDPHAPIFEVSDVRVIGDAKAVLCSLNNHIRQSRSQ